MSQASKKEAAIVVSEEDVSSHLLRNPDFLSRHPEVLREMELAGADGGAGSLLRKQMDTLRAENQKLRDALSAAQHIAELNESASAKVGKLVDSLLATSDLEELFQCLYATLAEDFAIPHSTVRIFPAAGSDGGAVHEQARKLRMLFPEAQMLKKAQCDGLSPEQAEFLFGEAAASLRSFALVPLGSGGWHGMLCIGCEDRHRFTAGHDTQLLDHLGHVLTALLQPKVAGRSKG